MYQKAYLFRAQAPQLNVFGSEVSEIHNETTKIKHEAQAKLQELNITLNERTKPPRLYMIIHPIQSTSYTIFLLPSKSNMIARSLPNE
jgi:hypothetical protein